MDYETWMEQPLIWGERCRGRSLAWTPGASWFVNDPLGPVPHIHEDATEIAYLAQGNMEIEVGGSKRIYRAGDFLLMPAGKFHDYRLHGDETACLFVLVAPNHKHARWRTSDFPARAHEGDAPYAKAGERADLPSNEHIASTVCTLQPGDTTPEAVLPLQDRVIYVIGGTAQITLGTLSGPLAGDQYQYIPATVRHRIANAGYEPLVYLSMVVTDPSTAHGTELAGSR